MSYMGRYDSGEHYESKQFNDFPEYKPFRAEEYYSAEAAKTPPETGTVSEHFGETAPHGKSTEKRIRSDSNDIRRKLEEMKESPHTSDSADTSSISSSSSASGSATSSASTSSSSTVGAASSASSAAAGSVAATTTVAAVAFIVIAVIGLFVNFSNFIKTHIGMDYMTLTVDIDEFIASESKADSLLPSDFAIEYDTEYGTERIALQSGKRTYLIAGLEPGSSFTYKVICTVPNLSSEYYTDTVSVPTFSEPTGVFDEINSYVSLDGETESAAFSYSVYLSDCTHKYSGAAFYICSSEQVSPSDIASVIYSSDTLDENGFFKGTAENITCENLYLYIAAENAEGDNVFLFSYVLDTELPDEWITEPPDDNGNTGGDNTDGDNTGGDNTGGDNTDGDTPVDENVIFAIDSESETEECLLDNILISGNLTHLDTSASLGVYFAQYNSSGELIENTEGSLTVYSELMTYSLECGARYGVSAYKYVIFAYANGLDGETVTVYESDIKSFTADQSYAASYNKVLPADATLTYGDGFIRITVNPEFSTERIDVFRYKLAVVNSASEVFGEYYGTEEAVITVSDLEGLDEINFVYYDCAEFLGDIIEYESYALEGAQFCVPSLTLSDTLGFNGEFFTLSYTLDMIYNYDYASLKLEIITGDGGSFVRSVDGLSESGTIVLSEIYGELGNVTVSAYLTFEDNFSGGAGHELLAASAGYVMNYSFTVTSVNADVSGYNATTIPVTVKFDNSYIPNTYNLTFTDSEGYVNVTVPISDGVCSFDTIPIELDDTLTVTVIDAEGNQWGNPYTYNISKSKAKENYTYPTFNAVNPGGALVTYNDDGTINIYRDVMFSSEDENVYYNAFIYSLGQEENEDGTIAYDRSYDIIGRDRYAVIENIPMDTYILIYYFMFDFDGVSYVMYTETPSGSVYFPESFGTVEVLKENGSTSVNVQLTDYGYAEDRVTVNGVDYSYSSDGGSINNISLVIDGEIDITSVTVYYNEYPCNYESISADIEVRGNLYKAITFDLTPAY